MSKSSTPLSAGRPSARNKNTTTLASLSDPPAMKRVNFDVTAEQHRKLKVYAANQGKTIRELLTEYVENLVE